MITKEPAVYDISHWKEVLDFSVISPRPVLIFTKATEAAPNTVYRHTDDKFVRFFEGMAGAGIRRGAYHFFRKSVDAKTQAGHFENVIRPHTTVLDSIALDIEEGGETAAQIITFCDYIQSAFPRNIFLIYSRKTVLDLVYMNQTQKNRLKNIPTWVAGYPDSPDFYDEVPSWYVPDQSKWGNVWLWQYSSHGAIEGIHGDVDMNWINPIYYDLLKHDVITPPHGVNKPSSLFTFHNGIETKYNHIG